MELILMLHRQRLTTLGQGGKVLRRTPEVCIIIRIIHIGDYTHKDKSLL